MASKRKRREFNVIIERDTAGYYVASVPQLRGCYTQARSIDVLMRRIREVIDLCLQEEEADSPGSEFVGVQRVAV
jgi:predicted RNase H-like HicB family nuclease